MIWRVLKVSSDFVQCYLLCYIYPPVPVGDTKGTRDSLLRTHPRAYIKRSTADKGYYLDQLSICKLGDVTEAEGSSLSGAQALKDNIML